MIDLYQYMFSVNLTIVEKRDANHWAHFSNIFATVYADTL